MPEFLARAKNFLYVSQGGPGGGFHERARTPTPSFFEQRFFSLLIYLAVSLDSIVVSVLMPITSLFFELRTPSVPIFESRHFSSVFLLIACFPRALFIFLRPIGISVTIFRLEQIDFVSLTYFCEKVRCNNRILLLMSNFRTRYQRQESHSLFE